MTEIRRDPQPESSSKLDNALLGSAILKEMTEPKDLAGDDFAPAVRRGDVNVITRPSLSYWQDAWLRLKKNRQAVISLAIIVGMLLFTLVGPVFWTVDPTEQDLTRISQAPSFKTPAVVLAELDTFEEVILPEPTKAIEKPAAELGAPATIEFLVPPSTQGVRLKWSPVEGAQGYAVYRNDTRPTSHENLGVPIGETDAGNKVSYEDKFDLKSGTYFYSVIPKSGFEEGQKYATIETELKVSISITQAQLIKPDVQLGDTIELPSRPFGTDYLGRDVLSRLMSGARVSLFIGLVAPFLAMLLGILVGGISGFAGGRVDSLLMRFTDFVLALPFLLFMILFRVTFGASAGESGITAMLVALVVLSWTGPARLVRGQILQLRESEFVQAAKLLGARSGYVILRHLLPNTMGVILVSLTFSIPGAIFTEAFLSFIGMGVAPPTASWGSLCNEGVQTFLTHPHEFFFPAIFISLTVLAFNLFGDGLRDALDPKMRGVQ
jgi:oligopeptide transport system permease protein